MWMPCGKVDCMLVDVTISSRTPDGRYSGVAPLALSVDGRADLTPASPTAVEGSAALGSRPSAWHLLRDILSFCCISRFPMTRIPPEFATHCVKLESRIVAIRVPTCMWWRKPMKHQVDLFGTNGGSTDGPSTISQYPRMARAIHGFCHSSLA